MWSYYKIESTALSIIHVFICSTDKLSLGEVKGYLSYSQLSSICTTVYDKEIGYCYQVYNMLRVLVAILSIFSHSSHGQLSP